jgi:type II secretory pathway pseudopilin PulG
MRTRPDDDAGFTLIDMMVGMTLMTIVMAVFTGAIVRMYRVANNVDAKSVAQASINVAMQRLDREVRYAKGISTPYLVNNNQYVDMLSIQRVGANTVQQCIQVRVVSGVLAQRTWTFNASPLNLTAWVPLANGLTSATPFTYRPPNDSVGYQQLTVALASGSGSSADSNTTTFIALNSDRTTSQDYCNAARAIP